LHALKLQPIEAELLARRSTSSAAACDAYLKGRYFLHQFLESSNQEDLSKASDLFAQAIQADPKFARAYMSLATVHFIQATPKNDLQQKAEVSVHKALELDDNLSYAHVLLANIKMYHDYDWQGAKANYERALEIDPNDDAAYDYYAGYYSMQGQHDEALRLLQRAKELDPFSVVVDLDEGLYPYMARRYDQAITELEHASALHPKAADPPRFLVHAYELTRQLPKAR